MEKLGAVEGELKQVQEDELIQVQMDTTATDANVELESESHQQNTAEETVAESQNIAAEQAAVETDEPSNLGEQVEKDASLLAPASGAAVMGAVATAAASGVFEPVMTTWANVGEVTEDEQAPIKADHSPPLSSSFPGSEEQSTRHSEAGDPELSQDTPTPSDAIDSVSGNAAAVVADASLDTADAVEFHFEVNENADAQDESAESLESVASLPEELSAQELSRDESPQESPDASDLGELTLNTQSWSPALGALARLDDKVEPSDFERAMAERLLETEFGHHIQTMSNRITQTIQDPTVLFFLSLEPTEQQTDVVGGLAMYVCAQREAPTLLVDADTTQKWLSKRLGNIGDGLIEATDDTRPWYESVAATSCERLRYLRIGNAELDASNIDDLRGSVKYMMSDWKDSFGLVLIDGGAIDSKLVPIFADLADATYLTVKLGSDEREELAWATEQLSGFGASLKGCITTGPTS